MTTNSQPTNTPHYPEQVTGMYILARALKNVGIETVYGLVGIPITEAAYMIQGQGIRFVGFRHEQQAGMAAATDGFPYDCILTWIHERTYCHSQCHSQLLPYDPDFRSF